MRLIVFCLAKYLYLPQIFNVQGSTFKILNTLDWSFSIKRLEK